MSNSLKIISPGHKDYFNKELTESEISELLSKYPLHQVLDLLLKIDVLLNFARKKTNGIRGATEAQIEIVKAIMPGSTKNRLLRDLQKQRRDSDISPIFLFSRGQINVLRKLALKVCAFEDNGISIWEDIKKRDPAISKIFLGANDLLASEYPQIYTNSTMEDIFRYFCANYSVNQNPETKKKLVRAYLMFKKLKTPVLSYSSFDELFMDKLKISFIEFLSIAFAIMSPFFGKTEDIILQPLFIDPNKFVKASQLDQKLFERAFTLFSCELEEARHGTQDELGRSMDYFTKNPLLRLEKAGDIKYFALDAISLLDKFTINISWILGNRTVETEALQTYKGKCFDNYFRFFLEKYCKIRGLKFRYIPDKGKGELGDGIIIDEQNKVIIFFEAKSTQAPEKVKISGDLAFYSEKIAKFGEQQLKALKKYQQLISSEGGDPDHYTFFPVIVLMENFPIDDNLQKHFRKAIQDRVDGYPTRTKEIEITTISAIEGAYEIKATLTEVLINKYKTESNKHSYLGNFIYAYYSEQAYDFLPDEMKEMFGEMEETLALTK